MSNIILVAETGSDILKDIAEEMGILSPLLGYILSIVAIVMSLKKKAYKEDKKYIISLVVGIIALIVSLVSHITGIILLLNV
ncbi:hypothetical protein [uncultured Clostridium sp.]|uniref:hypothetical protein n=1 Tax=uncultured Clostridium sp. TaxID=59620 RepID=UPI0025D3C5E9|nr:hypothetical protein [uncultured Clostridium sp.]